MPALRYSLLTVTLLLLGTSITLPTAQAQSDERGGRRGPPPEALEACADKAEGDSCSFSGPRGDAEGSCIVPPRDSEVLACAPADRGGKRMAPAEENDT